MNLFAYLGDAIEEEKSDILYCNDTTVRVERIVSNGQVSPAGFWYDQEEDEWVAVLQGEGRIQYESGEVTILRAGDWMLLPAGMRHRVSYTSQMPPCIWLCVFSSRRGANESAR